MSIGQVLYLRISVYRFMRTDNLRSVAFKLDSSFPMKMIGKLLNILQLRDQNVNNH